MTTEKKLRVQFAGAAGQVTGSRTLLEAGGTRVYVDCGMYQGPKYISDRNYLPFQEKPSTIDAVFLTHAHVDHCGLLPLLVRKGFSGPIYCTKPTKDLLAIVLPDAAGILKDEFRRLPDKFKTKEELSQPLYDSLDAEKTISLLRAVDLEEPVRVGCMRAKWHQAGHILGAAGVYVQSEPPGGAPRSIYFSGDLGPGHPILHPKKLPAPPADYIVMESTYGDRVHEKEDVEAIISDAVQRVIHRKGMLVMPAFSIGRTQLMLYIMYKMQKKGSLPQLPIYLDSPMALRVTELYEAYRQELNVPIQDAGFYDFLESSRVQRIRDVEESKALVDSRGPGIIVSASGMCSGGRVVFHLRSRIEDPRNMILFTGYQAEATLGRQILDGNARVNILGSEYVVRAAVASLKSLSAHADHNDLLAWASSFDREKLKTLFLNHGLDEPRAHLKESIQKKWDIDIEIPGYLSTYYL